jgi:hypothetical protein
VTYKPLGKPVTNKRPKKIENAKKTDGSEVATKSRLNLFTATFMARSRWKSVFLVLGLIYALICPNTLPSES